MNYIHSHQKQVKHPTKNEQQFGMKSRHVVKPDESGLQEKTEHKKQKET